MIATWASDNVTWAGRRFARALVVALCGGLLAAGTASAAVTTSNVTSPADGASVLYNPAGDPGATVTVSGTSNGSKGDEVDIDCYNGAAPISDTYPTSVNKGVAVAADGSFSVQLPVATFAGNGCDLVAVPAGTTPALGTKYTGPRVGFSAILTSTVVGGPNSGDTYDFNFADAGASGTAGVASAGDCGPFQSVYATTTMVRSPNTIDCAGSLFAQRSDFSSSTTPDVTRSLIQIDGDNAYGSADAYKLAPGNTGFPNLKASLDSFNASTGAAQTTESESLVKCSPTDVYSPSAADCAAFAGTGVTIKRVTDFSHEGSVVTQTDTYSSTDGRSHSLDLEYDTDISSLTAGWELPGQDKFAARATGDTAGGPGQAVGTVYVINQVADAGSLSNPIEAMTFSTPYTGVSFDNTLFSKDSQDTALFHFVRTIPAGGSVTIAWSYAIATDLTSAQAYAGQAQASFPGAPPYVVTGAASVHGTSTAKLSATVTAGADAVSYAFEYGPTTAYGHTTPLRSLPAGATPSPVSAALAKLTGGTTYHYRIVAAGVAGRAFGTDRTFRTGRYALKRLSVNVTPRTATHRPFRYRVFGSLTLPAGVSRAKGCTGQVSIVVKRGRKTVSSARARVSRKCAYSQTRSYSASQLPSSGTIAVTVRYLGSKLILPRSARAARVRYI